MKKLFTISMTVLLLSALTACATHPSGMRVGMSRDEVISRFGSPHVERRAADGELFIYSTAPMGQAAYAARVGPDQRVTAVEQVLTLQNFAAIKPNEWDSEQVLVHFGPPAEIQRWAPDKIWWSYRYKESGVWDSLMNIRFDAQGIVRETINTPDPLFRIDVEVRW